MDRSPKTTAGLGQGARPLSLVLKRLCSSRPARPLLNPFPPAEHSLLPTAYTGERIDSSLRLDRGHKGLRVHREFVDVAGKMGSAPSVPQPSSASP